MKGLARLLAALPILLPVFCGCATRPSPAASPKEIIEELPPQVFLRLQVIALHEAANPSGGAPFPALGFRFSGDRVVPVEKPETIAGVELTTPQLGRWMDNLRKDGATLVAAPQPFAVGPNLSASAANSTERRYEANWTVDSKGATAQSAVLVPQFKFTAEPDLVPGTRDLLTSVDAEMDAADLDRFILVDSFASKDGKAMPLSLFLPRRAIEHMVTQTLVQPGRTLVLAHYVNQYRASPQPPTRLSQGGPEQESQGPPGTAEDVRDHLFYLLSVERRGPEGRSDLPIVPQIPPRYALTLCWLESQSAPPASRPAPAAAPDPAVGDLPELQQTAARMKDAPDASCRTLSLALTARTRAQFEIAEEHGYVAGIHGDTPEATGPYSFLVNQTWTGIQISAQLEPSSQGVATALKLRLADAPRYDNAVGKLPAMSAGAPTSEAKEYHFQTVGQVSSDFASTRLLRTGQTLLLALDWHTAGHGPKNARLRQAAVSLSEPPVPPPEPEPQGGAPAAPANP